MVKTLLIAKIHDILITNAGITLPFGLEHHQRVHFRSTHPSADTESLKKLDHTYIK